MNPIVDGAILLDVLGENSLVVVERYSTATGLDELGNPVVAAPSLLSRTMAVHPMSNETIERLNLDRAEKWMSFYSNEDLRVAGTTGKGDVVQFGGERYQLLVLEDYGTIGGLWEAHGKRIE